MYTKEELDRFVKTFCIHSAMIRDEFIKILNQSNLFRHSITKNDFMLFEDGSGKITIGFVVRDSDLIEPEYFHEVMEFSITPDGASKSEKHRDIRVLIQTKSKIKNHQRLIEETHHHHDDIRDDDNYITVEMHEIELHIRDVIKQRKMMLIQENSKIDHVS